MNEGVFQRNHTLVVVLVSDAIEPQLRRKRELLPEQRVLLGLVSGVILGCSVRLLDRWQ